MRTNTILKHIADTLPHQSGQYVEVEYFSDSQQKTIKANGTIYNRIGYGGIDYRLNIRLDNGMIVAEARPENVIILTK